MNLAEAISGMTADLKESNDRADRMTLVRELTAAVSAAAGMFPTRTLKAIATDDWHDLGMLIGWAWKIQHDVPREYEPETPEPKRKPSDEELEGISFDRSRM